MSFFYILFADLVGFYTHKHICTFFVTFFSATIDGTDLIFGHKLHKGTQYRGKRFAYTCMFNVYKNQLSRHTGSRNLTGPKTLPTIWYTYMTLVVDFYTHWTYVLYMSIFSHIFLSNYWWQKSDIWSQASYRYTILWVVFLDPSDSYFLCADLVGFYTH
jgi:hypothetical protein